MIRVESLPLGRDLRPLLQICRSRGLFLSVSEESGEQVSWAHTPADSDSAAELIRRFEAGEFVEQLSAARAGVATRKSLPNALVALLWRLLRFARSCPLSSTLALLSLAVAALSGVGRDVSGVLWLFFPALAADSLAQLLAQLASPLLFLRSLGPALLHFGEVHLVFNLLWLIYFGRLLEREQPRGMVLAVFVIATFSGNVVQYAATGSNAFGGLSGLIYGLVGYTWVVGMLVNSGQVRLRTSTFAVFVAALLAMAVLASDSIASGAHAGGLAAGMLCGIAVGLWQRVRA